MSINDFVSFITHLACSSRHPLFSQQPYSPHLTPVLSEMIIPGLKHITNKGENYACSLCGELTSPKRLLEHITSKSHALECLKKDHVEGQLYLNKVCSVVFKVVHLGWEFSTCRHLVEFVLTCYQLLDCPFTVLQLPPPNTAVLRWQGWGSTGGLSLSPLKRWLKSLVQVSAISIVNYI